MKQAHEDTTQIIGIHTFKVYDMSSPSAQSLEGKIESLIKNKSRIDFETYKKTYTDFMRQLQQYCVREKVVKNLITTAGRSVLAQRLANTTTYTGIINYGILGTSATAVANGDTQLGTEVFRKVVASASYTSNVAFIDFFYTKADTNGTYQEFGTAIDGTASANTGQLFTHALTGGWTKSSSESMTVSCQYTFS
jgi:hypothetical protein